MTSVTTTSPLPLPVRPPAWLIAATAALAFATLVMAVAETTLWKHYLIDRGEYFSLAGLAFIAVAGLVAYRQRRLAASLPLAFPWLLFPVITQGDQLIDHLTINQMRLITHVLLGALFAMPVAVIVIAVRYAAPAVSRTARWLLAAALLAAELWVAVKFLGTLMVVTLAIMIAACVVLAMRRERAAAASRREGWALAVLLGGVVLSLGLYVGFKHRPGAYQGSPAYYMDPSQKDAFYALDSVAVPEGAIEAPSAPVAAEAAAVLGLYGDALAEMLQGYYVADRNYNYAFHNALFLRETPVLPNFRQVALDHGRRAAALAAEADARADALSTDLPAASTPLGALIAEAREYTAFNLRRFAMLERMSGGFEQTQSGLQHATHLYEGEGKVFGERLVEALGKHHSVLDAPALDPVTGGFERKATDIRDRYANRIVGF